MAFCPPELQLTKTNASEIEAPFFDLHLSITKLSKMYDKHGGFDFYIVKFPVLDGNVPRSTS